MSLLHPLTCGFAKVAAYETVKMPVEVEPIEKECTQSLKSRLQAKCLQQFHENFLTVMDNFTVSYKNSVHVFPLLKTKFSDWGKRYKTDVLQYTNTFSTESWKALTDEEKTQHKLENCDKCFNHFYETFQLFPVRGPSNKKIWDERYKRKNQTETNALEAARKLVKDANSPFKRQHGMSLLEAQMKCPEMRLEKKKSYEEKRNEKLKIICDTKNKQEQLYEETAVERYP